MHTHGNGKETVNGQEQEQTASASHRGQPRFLEGPAGTILDTSSAVYRFYPLMGGRLGKWQWRTVPPVEAMRPHGEKTPALFDLVDSKSGALIDHFLPLGTRPEEFAKGQHHELGDFVAEPYRSQTVDSGGEFRIGLLRDGAIRAGKRVAEVRMAKSAAVRPGAADLSVLYRIINSSLRPLQVLFAVEFNLFAPGLSAGQSRDGYFLIDGVRPEGDSSLGSGGVSPNATHAALVNPAGEMALQMGWDRESDLWRIPGPGGGSTVRLLAVWRIQLPPRDNWAMGMWLAPG